MKNITILTTTIQQHLAPNIFDPEISELEHECLLSYGGLNIRNPTKNVRSCHETCRKFTEKLISAIKNGQHSSKYERSCTLKGGLSQKGKLIFLKTKFKAR